SFDENYAHFCDLLVVEQNFDINKRVFYAGTRKCGIFQIKGTAKSFDTTAILTYIMESGEATDEKAVMDKMIPYIEASTEKDILKAADNIYMGNAVLFVDGIDCAFIIDAKTLPQRNIEEPEKDKVIRGSRDGFVEIPIFNAALLRRRIRSNELRLERIIVGNKSKSDIIVAYMDTKCDKKFLEKLKEKLKKLDIESTAMNQETISENLFPHKWYNPLPIVKYSERPDYTSAAILQGSIVLIIDNSPSVMILPSKFLDFMSEANDYYFPPFTGTYYRIIKTVMILLALFWAPIWLYFMENQEIIPEWLSFLRSREEAVAVPIAVQMIIMEFTFEAMRISTLNSPQNLGATIGIVGALLVGDFAVQSGWLTSSVVFYMAFFSITLMAAPSIEVGYAIKFFRVFLILMTWIFKLPGLIVGTLAILSLAATTKTVSGKPYFYPIIPLDFRVLVKSLIRPRLKR
ncbi:MAG: spore germination protein, partial [Clostridia bacterium]|nr:spore germination protein [Clostridia bacterium]